METMQNESGLFKLPQEIRLMIYEPALRHGFIKVGGEQINSKNLAKWPQQPGICRACRLLRSETLAMYYAVANIQLNIQRPSGEHMVLAWITAISSGSPWAFNHIRNVSIITGVGHNDPPKEYRIDMQQSTFISAFRPCLAAYLYNYRGHPRNWSPLVWGALKRRLARIPSSEQPNFDVAEGLREVIATVGELSGFALDGNWVHLDSPSTTPTTQMNKSSVSPESRLLALPRELRLAIYEYTFSTDTEVVIGERDLRNQLLTDGPATPGLLRTSSFIREEALPAYFAHTQFLLNIQRILCEQVVYEWIQRCSCEFPTAFRRLNFISIIAGSGISQPPRQYKFQMQQSVVLSVTNRPTWLPYALPAQLWQPAKLEAVQQRLREMPKRFYAEFDVVQNVREIIEMLAK